MVRGVLDRLMTHLSIHVWFRLEGGSLGTGLESTVLLEGDRTWVWQELWLGWKLEWKLWIYWMAHFGVCSRCFGCQYC